MLNYKYIVTSFKFCTNFKQVFPHLAKNGSVVWSSLPHSYETAVCRTLAVQSLDIKIFEKFYKYKVKIATQYAYAKILNFNCVLLFTFKLFIDAEKIVCSQNKRFVWNFIF